MSEPEFYNYSPFAADLLPILDREGAECRVAVIKATYALHSNGVPDIAEKPRPIRLGDEMWGDPAVADIRYPSDLCAYKPGTDFLVVGHAVAPRGVAPDHVDVIIQFAGRTKFLRVYGERQWERGVTGPRLGTPQPLTRVPLAWSRSYGGFDASDPAHPVEDPRNPVGRGVARDVTTLLGKPAPQIESPESPIGLAGSRSQPAGCAAIGRHYEPRRRYAGTYDAAWLHDRHPAAPLDYRDEFQQAAPPDQVFQTPLRGGELIRIDGVSADAPVACRLPVLAIVVQAEVDGQTHTQRPHLDTALVDTDAKVLELTWRASFRCPAKMRNRFTVVRTNAKMEWP
ncbi:MAG: DUF2169 family type VI secretion system accessory protein [Gemmatimonadales bacterium]